MTHCQYIDRQTPVSKYPHTPKLPRISLDYPGMTHCQQADPSVKVSLYAKVTLDLPGLSKNNPVPAGRPLCQSIPVCHSLVPRPHPQKGGRGSGDIRALSRFLQAQHSYF